MNQPLVTVVVPIYNVEQYLDRCITSVVNQTYSNLEIILVDDGSPDRCPAICDAWAEKDFRIKVIHKKNAGLGMARNSGIDSASGKYIFFFDSDDYVDVLTVEKCVESAEKFQSDAVIFGRWDVHDDGRINEKPVSTKKVLFQGEEIRNDLLPKMFTYEMGFGVSVWGKMYRLQTLVDHGLRFVSEREIISEDAYFALEFYAKAATITVVRESFYYYVKRGNSLTRAYQEDRQEKNDIFLKKSLACINRLGLPRLVYSHLKVRYHFYTLAAMKQIAAAEIAQNKKNKALLDIMRSPILRKTITMDVLRIEKPALRVFWIVLKLRCYWLVLWMLKKRMESA